ncbi:hypothetical protein ACFQ60_38205 [Streptomyces zhihengii]
MGLAAVALWAAFFALESAADRQKARFAARCRREGCAAPATPACGATAATPTTSVSGCSGTA